MKNIAQELNKVSVFGPCDVSHIQSLESENREKERKMRLEQKKRMEEIKEAEKIRKQQEEEDYNFAVMEHQKLNSLYEWPSKTLGRGRGTMIKQILESKPPPRVPKGRGRYSRTSQTASKGYDFNKDNLVANQITKAIGGEQLYRNNLQEQYFQGDIRSANYPEEDIYSPVISSGDIAAGYSEDNFYSSYHNVNDEEPTPSYFEYDQRTDLQPDCNSLYPVSKLTTVNCDQFEDTESNSSSYLSAKPGSSPFESASSSIAASPVPKALSPGPSALLARKPPRCRLAAKFSNPITAEESSYVSQRDFFTDPSAHRPPTSTLLTSTQQGGVSINSLTASQRIIGDGGVRSIDLLNNYRLYSRDIEGFQLNQNEFPPLS